MDGKSSGALFVEPFSLGKSFRVFSSSRKKILGKPDRPNFDIDLLTCQPGIDQIS